MGRMKAVRIIGPQLIILVVVTHGKWFFVLSLGDNMTSHTYMAFPLYWHVMKSIEFLLSNVMS